MRTPGEPVTALTERTFTGQTLDSRTGLMYYRARWYDPRLGRFIQADTVVPEPGNPQALNRYAYAVGNPVRYNDPSGHWYGPDRYDPAGIETPEEAIEFWSMALTLMVPVYSQSEAGKWPGNDDARVVQIAGSACGPTAEAMVMDYWRSQYSIPLKGVQATTREAEALKLYYPTDSKLIFTSPAHMVALAQHHLGEMEGTGLQVHSGQIHSPEEGMALLQRYIARGLPVIVDATTWLHANGSNAAHFVVVTGMTPNGQELYVHDPFSRGDLNGNGHIDRAEQQGGIRAVSWSDFYWAWTHNSDAGVGGAGWWMAVQPSLLWR